MRNVNRLERKPLSAVDRWMGVARRIFGPNHGLLIGGTKDSETVEIRGHLPLALRNGFKFAHGYWENSPKPGVPWDDKLAAVWHLSEDGWGPRLAIPSEAALMDLLIARREMLKKGSACSL